MSIRNGSDPQAGSVTPLGPELGLAFHHVGVAVRSMEEALATYVGLFGFEQVGDPVEVPPEKVRVCFVRPPSGPMIELVEGLTDESPVHGVIERTGGGTYHICYRVDDLDDAVRRLKRRRCFPFRRFEVDAPGLRRFAFLLTPDRQLFELCEADHGATHV